MEVQLTSIERISRVSKNTGKPYTSVIVKTDKHGDKKISGFANVDNADWEIGSVVSLDIEEKNGYLNFNSPKKDSSPAARESSGGLAEVANILKLQILPKIETIRKDQIAILEKLGMDDGDPYGGLDVKGF